MSSFLAIWIADAISLWILDFFFRSISFNNMGAVLGTALILALLNKTIKPVLKFISFPITLLTFGFFALVVNAFILKLAFSLSGMPVTFGTAFMAGIVLSLISSLVCNAMGVIK